MSGTAETCGLKQRRLPPWGPAKRLSVLALPIAILMAIPMAIPMAILMAIQIAIQLIVQVLLRADIIKLGPQIVAGALQRPLEEVA